MDQRQQAIAGALVVIRYYFDVAQALSLTPAGNGNCLDGRPAV